jgi:hypothetical protein
MDVSDIRQSRRDRWEIAQRSRRRSGRHLGMMPDAQPRLDADLDTHALYGDLERFLCRFGTIDRLPESKSTMPPSMLT